MPTSAEAIEAELVSALHAFRKHSRERKAALLSAFRMLRKQHDYEVADLKRIEERLARALDPDRRVIPEGIMVNWSPGSMEDVVDVSEMPSGNIVEALDDIKSAKEEVSKKARFGSFTRRPGVTARRKLR